MLTKNHPENNGVSGYTAKPDSHSNEDSPNGSSSSHDQPRLETAPRRTSWKTKKLARIAWESNPRIRPLNRLKEQLGFYEYIISPGDDTPFAQTPLAKLFDEKEGATLAYHHDHRLLPAGDRLVDLRDEIEEGKRPDNDVIIKDNSLLDDDQKAIRSKMEKAVTSFDDRQQSLQKEILKARLNGANAVAAVGEFLDPSKPLIDCISRLKKRSEEIVAAKLKAPWTASESTLMMNPYVVVFITLAFGVCLGISWGLSTHKLDGSQLLRDKWLLFLFCVLGAAVASPIGYSIYASFRATSERYWMGLSRSSWLPFLMTAIGLALFYCLVDCGVLQYGLLVDQQVTQAVGSMVGSETVEVAGSINPIGAFFSGLMISPPMAAAHAWMGYFAGRQSACRNRIHLAQHEGFEPCEKQSKTRPNFTKALEAVSLIAALEHQQKEARENLLKEEAAFEKKIAKSEKKRKSLQKGLTHEEKMRLDKEHRTWTGTQQEFNAALNEAIRRRHAREGSSTTLPSTVRWRFNWWQGGAICGAFILGLLLFLGSLWSLGL